jgi:hypothetical protein
MVFFSLSAFASYLVGCSGSENKYHKNRKPGIAKTKSKLMLSKGSEE